MMNAQAPSNIAIGTGASYAIVSLATMKLRRNVIADKYAAVIDGFYADGAG